MVNPLPKVLQTPGMGEHFPHCGWSVRNVLVNGGEDADGKVV